GGGCELHGGGSSPRARGAHLMTRDYSSPHRKTDSLCAADSGPPQHPQTGAEVVPEARRFAPATIGRPHRDHLRTKHTAPARGRILRRDLATEASKFTPRTERPAKTGADQGGSPPRPRGARGRHPFEDFSQRAVAGRHEAGTAAGGRRPGRHPRPTKAV